MKLLYIAVATATMLCPVRAFAATGSDDQPACTSPQQGVLVCDLDFWPDPDKDRAPDTNDSATGSR